MGIELSTSAAGAISGAIVGGLVSLVLNGLTIWQQNRTLAHNRFTTEDAWLREKLHEIYSNCLIAVRSQEYIERNKWFTLLMLYHPHRGTSLYHDFVDKVKNGSVTLDDITQILDSDVRLQRIIDRK